MSLLKYYVFILPLLCNAKAVQEPSTVGYFGTSYVRDQTSSGASDSQSSQPRYIPAHSLSISRPVMKDFQPGRGQPATVVSTTPLPPLTQPPTTPTVPPTNPTFATTVETVNASRSDNTTNRPLALPFLPWQTTQMPFPTFVTPTDTQIINASFVITYPGTSAQPPIASFIFSHTTAGPYNFTPVSTPLPIGTFPPFINSYPPSFINPYPPPFINPSASTPLPSIAPPPSATPPVVLVTAPPQTTTWPTFSITSPTSTSETQTFSVLATESPNEYEPKPAINTSETEQPNLVLEQVTSTPSSPATSVFASEQDTVTTSSDSESTTSPEPSYNNELNSDNSPELTTVMLPIQTASESDSTVPPTGAKLQPISTTPDTDFVSQPISTPDLTPVTVPPINIPGHDSILVTYPVAAAESNSTTVSNDFEPQSSLLSQPSTQNLFELGLAMTPQTVTSATLEPVPKQQPNPITVSSQPAFVSYPLEYNSNNHNSIDPVFEPATGPSLYPIKIDFVCQAANNYYTVPNECDTYVECKQGVAMKQLCPDGLHFNWNTQWPDYPCAYPSEVQCPSAFINQFAKPTPECPHQYGFYPLKENNCSYYIMCHEGKATVMHCPYGLAFNFDKNSCDWPENVPNCNVEAFKDFTCPPPPLKIDGSISDIIYKYRYKNSCKSYIVCQRGYPRLLNCDPGLSYHQETQSCVNAQLVSCDA